VTVDILDSKGLRNPTARNQINFGVEGQGKIIGVCSFDPLGNQSFTKPVRKAYQGRCQVIIRAGNQPGQINLKAFSDGIQTAEIKILASGN
jgi:beta-galactosidase